jgi:hypothetical protein
MTLARKRAARSAAAIAAQLGGDDEDMMARELFDRAFRVVANVRRGLSGNTMRWMRFRATREVVEGMAASRYANGKLRKLDDGSWTLYGMPVVLTTERASGPAPWTLSLEIAS